MWSRPTARIRAELAAWALPGDLASPTGVEPVTYALGGRRAIQLCHGDVSRQYNKDSRELLRTLVRSPAARECANAAIQWPYELRPFRYYSLSE